MEQATVEAVVELARQQQQVVLRRQLNRLGFTTRLIDRRVTRGWLTPVLPGAYLVGPGPSRPWHRVVAASLLAGPEAVVSHWTAARVHQLPALPPPGHPELEVSLPLSVDRRLAEVSVHRVRAVPAEEVTLVRGIRVVAPARALVDIAADLEPAALERLLDEGALAGRWTLEQVAAALARSGPRAGVGSLRALMRWRDGRADRVDLEERAARVLACTNPVLQHQVIVGGRVFVVDLAWPAVKVAAECEGWAVRSRSRSKFDHERRKFNLLAVHGWTVVHLTAAMSDEEMRSAVVPLLLRAASERR
jgi:hypothetical protein